MKAVQNRSGGVWSRVIGAGLLVASVAHAQPGPRPGATFRDCPTCTLMSVIPAGRLPGSTLPPARPAITFAQGFALSRQAITGAEWQECVASLGCPGLPGLGADNEKLPLTRISFQEATAYVEWMSQKTGHRYHLPSQGQWLYIAGAGRPHVWGLQELGTRLREWVEDCWDEDESLIPDDGTPHLTVPSRCRQRTVATPFDAAVRRPMRPVDARERAEDLGFRVAREIEAHERLTLLSTTPVLTDAEVDAARRRVTGDSVRLAEEIHRGMVPLPAGPVAAFEIGRFEVTQRLWKKVMGDNPSFFKACGDECPVENISWRDALAFVERLNRLTDMDYRLPTEVEWEYACRAGQEQAYCGSDEPDEVAWYDANSRDHTHAVGRKQPNAWGLYDMSGNVWEWVEDRWTEGDSSGSSARRSSRNAENRRVYRGGSWLNRDQYVRMSYRYFGVSATRMSDLGLRLARSLRPTPAPSVVDGAR